MNKFLNIFAIAVVGLLVTANTFTVMKLVVDSKKDNTVVVSGSSDTKEIQKVKEEFNKIQSQSDKLVIYKLIAGAGEYLEVAENLQTTAQFDPIFGKVQTSYGWSREKYPDFTSAVSNYLVSVKYDEPKKLSTKEDKQNFAAIFKNLAEALK